HFRPPLDDETQWEGFHGGWAMMIVAQLTRPPQPRYVAAPRVHPRGARAADPPAPPPSEGRGYGSQRGRPPGAAVEIVSPANKDRPEHRRAFVAKCLALLQSQVCIAVVDLVTTRNFNLYGELLECIGQTDPSLGSEPPSLYAVACRPKSAGEAW